VKRIALVTGGLGTNGTWVMRELLDHDFDVVCFDSQLADDRIADIRDRIGLVTGDIRDSAAVSACIREHAVTTVVHLAAVLSVGAHADPGLALDVNVKGTWGVLAAARDAGLSRVVYASSFSVYGTFDGEFGDPGYRPVTEDMPRAPHGAQRVYGATKAASEELGLHMAETSPTSFIALRFSHILVPGLGAGHAGRQAHNELLDAVKKGEPVRIAQGGDQPVDFLYIKDLARAVRLACTAPAGISGVFNIGSGRLSTLRDLGAAARLVRPDADIRIGGGLDYLQMGPIYFRYDIERAREALNYQPGYDIPAAVASYMSIPDRLAGSNAITL
jgi:UDP-glucose 4-epimerase